MLSKTERKGELANVYLDPDQRFWHDVLRSYDDPWELVDCPVDASLEHRLWDEWTQSFNAGEYETCVAGDTATRRASTRRRMATFPDTGLGTGNRRRDARSRAGDLGGARRH